MSGRLCLRAVAAALAVGLSVELCGCGSLFAEPGPRPGPSAGPASGVIGTVGTVARADRTHEVPTPGGPEPVAGGASTPERAVAAFATAYVNWSAETVSARLRALARHSVGQARAELQLQAREVAADTELRRGRIANAGTVEAVGPLAGGRDRYVVVTRERTTAADDAAYRGLAPEWHVSVATVARNGRGWVVSGWQPES